MALTNFENMRLRLLTKAGLVDPPTPKYRLADLERTEWSDSFEQLMRNRLLMGALRSDGREAEETRSLGFTLGSSLQGRRLRAYRQHGIPRGRSELLSAGL